MSSRRGDTGLDNHFDHPLVPVKAEIQAFLGSRLRGNEQSREGNLLADHLDRLAIKPGADRIDGAAIEQPVTILRHIAKVRRQHDIR